MTPNSYRIFLYGPLTDDRVLSSVLGRQVSTSEAVLPGYRKFTEKEGENSYPTVEPDVEDPSKTVKGKTFHATTQDIYALDAWHGPYSRFLALLGDHQQAWVYYYTAVAARPEQGFVKTASADAAAPPPRSGPEGIAAALAEVDMDVLEQGAFEALQSGKKTARPEAIKKLKILQGLRKNKLHPKDMVWDSLPVVPPAFRPYAVMGDMLLAGDVNELYQDTISMADAYRELEQAAGKDSQALNEFKPQLYGAVRAATGFGKPVSTKGQERDLKGFMTKVLGSGPKYAHTTRKLLSKPQDFVGRAVIGVDPDLTIDEVGIPDDMAWSLFELPGQRRMVKDGVPVAQAVTEWAEHSDRARKARNAEVAERPVLYSRAPVWHQQGILAGMAKIVDGDQMMVNPVTTTGLGADFNGDAQIGKIAIIVREAEIQNLGLTYPIPLSLVEDMQTKNIIPAFDTSQFKLFLVDLEDFPRGEKTGTNPKGKNGIIDFYRVPGDIHAVAFDEATGRARWAPVSSYSVHPDREIELVRLRNGRTITTDDDPRAIYGIDPFTPSGEFVRDTPTKAEKRKIAIPVVRDVEDTLKNMQSIDCIPVDGVGEVSLDWDFGYLLGALAGDGWWDKKGYGRSKRWSVYLSDLKGHNALKVHSLLESLFGRVSWGRMEFSASDLPDRYGDTVRHTFHNEKFDLFCGFLTNWLGGGKTETSTGSGDKRLPDFHMLAPKEFKRGLLSGIIDTDGSISVSRSKGAEQLLIAMTSTSLRLANDVKFLCLGLGVTASVSYSKTTIRDNTSWICSISAPDAKKQNLFTELQCPWKRDAFIKTKVSDQNTSLAYDKVVLPQRIYELIGSAVYSPKGKPSALPEGEEKDWKLRARKAYYCWSDAKETRLASRSGIRTIIATNKAGAARALTLAAKAQEELADATVLTKEQMFRVKEAINALVSKTKDTPERVKEAGKMKKLLDIAVYKGKLTQGYRERLSTWLATTKPAKLLTDYPEFQEWSEKILEQEHIAWTCVEKVEKTGQKETGYDLTVPGYETFMSIDGVILSNTMNVHALLTPEAVKDAKEKLFPSKQLFSIRDQRRTLPEPKQDIVLGLYSSQANPSRNRHTYGDAETAMRDLRSGKAAWSDTVEIPDGAIPGV